MTSPNNAAPSEPSASLASSPASLRNPSTRYTTGVQSPKSSISSLPYRSSTSTPSLFASTPTPPGSRSISPNGALAPSRLLTSSVFVGTPQETSSQNAYTDQPKDPRYLIHHAFVPHIAVYSSSDTDELTTDKGFPRGLWQLLRPFGEHVQGKVVIRDSIGASKTYDDFGVRFVPLGNGLEDKRAMPVTRKSADIQFESSNGTTPAPESYRREGGDIETIENVIDKHLAYAESFPGDYFGSTDDSESETEPTAMSPFYTLYLRRLLSGLPLAPHETFAHPVACIIAISSRNANPIETLRRLYDDSSRGEKRLPLWINSEYLRYYVLVHDEERDDINKSLSLFEQMKRHFGLHCHLLRLRSSECVPTDDDSVQLPQCEWISAGEELTDIHLREGLEGVENSSPYVFESDSTAINTFVREMVTQSVIPSMERCVSTWNDQVASRRRGISGRFISLSKRWAGFGGGTRSNTPTGSLGGSSGSNSNYDGLQGFYRPDSPEALMRKLADYAFMLRDWKLAQSVYDLLRPDFNNDKAWKYHAAANEMAAISTLLASQNMNSKIRSETVDQMLETASYSYITRCDTPYGALRCLLLGMELLRLRSGSAPDDAARWGSRILEASMVGAVGDALVKERVAACYASRKGTGSQAWGSRTRKSALWRILAAEQWVNLGKHSQATRQLAEARRLYKALIHPDSLYQFADANDFLVRLERELLVFTSPEAEQYGLMTNHEVPLSDMDEESEALDARTHRRSLIGANVPPVSSLETAPLQTLTEDKANLDIKADDFQ